MTAERTVLIIWWTEAKFPFFRIRPCLHFMKMALPTGKPQGECNEQKQACSTAQHRHPVHQARCKAHSICRRQHAQSFTGADALQIHCDVDSCQEVIRKTKLSRLRGRAFRPAKTNNRRSVSRTPLRAPWHATNADNGRPTAPDQNRHRNEAPTRTGKPDRDK